MNIIRRADAFHTDLAKIETMLTKMGRKVGVQVINSGFALLEQDQDLARKVGKKDIKINSLESKIDIKAILLIEEYQPTGQDLRSAIAALKVSAALERMGDYAKTLSYRVRAVEDFSAMKSALTALQETSQMVAEMLDLAMQAYVERNLTKAKAARDLDVEINDRTDALFRELSTYMIETPRNIEPCMHLMFISKNMERSGDQVKTIARQVRYLLTGKS